MFSRLSASFASQGSIDSSSRNRIIAATAAISFVIEAARKTVSRFTGAGSAEGQSSKGLHMNFVIVTDQRNQPRQVRRLNVGQPVSILAPPGIGPK